MSNIQKRFIAGAVCPNCGLQDKIVVFHIAGKDFAECVRCGHKQQAENTKAEKQADKPTKKVIWLQKSE